MNGFRTGLAGYRQVLAHPGLRGLLLFAVVARIPHTAAAMALTLHVVQGLDRGYAAAGLAATATTLGAALGAPWRGHVVDKVGVRRALVPSILAEGIVFGSIGFVSFPVLLVLSFIGGLLMLPMFTIVRASIAAQAGLGVRRSAYSLDSIGVEFSFMSGPALASVLATMASTRVALIAVGLTSVAAGIALWVFDPPMRSAEEESAAPDVRARSRKRDLLWRRPMLAVLGATFGATLVLYGTDVSAIAQLRHLDAVVLTGVAFGFWGLGSIAGALTYGAMPRAVHPAWLLVGLSVMTLPLGMGSTVIELSLLLFVAGGLCAPVISASAEAVAELVPARRRGVAMGWHGSALTLGGAVGGPLAGAALDATGPAGGPLAVGAAGILLGAACLVLRREAVTS